MEKKGIAQIYREGWKIIVKALLFGLAISVIGIPFRILEFYGGSMPQWAAAVAALVIVFIYLPFAAYFVYNAAIDFGKTEHKFIPLIDRIRKNKKIQSEEGR